MWWSGLSPWMHASNFHRQPKMHPKKFLLSLIFFLSFYSLTHSLFLFLSLSLFLSRSLSLSLSLSCSNSLSNSFDWYVAVLFEVDLIDKKYVFGFDPQQQKSAETKGDLTEQILEALKKREVQWPIL